MPLFPGKKRVGKGSENLEEKEDSQLHSERKCRDTRERKLILCMCV